MLCEGRAYRDFEHTGSGITVTVDATDAMRDSVMVSTISGMLRELGMDTVLSEFARAAECRGLSTTVDMRDQPVVAPEQFSGQSLRDVFAQLDIQGMSEDEKATYIDDEVDKFAESLDMDALSQELSSDVVADAVDVVDMRTPLEMYGDISHNIDRMQRLSVNRFLEENKVRDAIDLKLSVADVTESWLAYFGAEVLRHLGTGRSDMMEAARSFDKELVSRIVNADGEYDDGVDEYSIGCRYYGVTSLDIADVSGLRVYDEDEQV